MHDRLSGCIQLVFKVVARLTSCDIDICLTLKGIKLISEGNTLYLNSAPVNSCSFASSSVMLSII